MKNKGFTLIELIATIAVLGLLMIIVFPNVLNMIEKKNGEIDKATLDIFSSAADEYIMNNPNSYPKNIGDTYEFCITALDNENLIPIDIKKYKYDGIQVKIGEKNSYTIITDKCKPIGEVTKDLLDNNTEYGNYTYMEGTYLKGEQNSNYVWYNGFLWRIMGKNSDGTIRLITEENVTAIPWGALGDANWNVEGYIKDWLENYFYNSLDSNKTNIIENSKWCINPTAVSGSMRTDCDGVPLVESKVGLISLDEYNLSGASETNNTYGLVNSQYYWTLTPKDDDYVWSIYFTGAEYSGRDITDAVGVRPIINVSANAMIAGGNGELKQNASDTENGPYILNQTTSNKIGNLKNNVSSGEYVSFKGKIYRVVSKNLNGTKLILDGYYPANDIAYGSNNIFSTSTGIGQILNVEVLSWLDSSNSDKIISSDWYSFNSYGFGTRYGQFLDETTSSISAKVGLIRVGEMLSGQSASILTNNYTIRSNYENARPYWTINKYPDISLIWGIHSDCHAYFYDVAGVHGFNAIRPVIVVDTSTTITSGNGTLQSPYVID